MADNFAENEMTPLKESSEILNNDNTETVVDTVEVAPESDNSVVADGMIEETTQSEIAPVTEIIPKVESETEAVAEVESETEAVAEVESETEAVAEVESETEAVAEVETKSAIEPEQAKEKPASKPKESYHNPKFDALFEQIRNIKENNGTIEVTVKERIKGGLRVMYDEMPLFLPASHFALKRSPSEQSMKDAIGKKLEVHIHELQEDGTKRKTVIVSRKQILEDKYWNSIKIGDEIEGPITSIAPFGIFVDIYGVEGLVHVSRLSNSRIEDLKQNFKKGQLVKAVIVEINKDNKRIGLSTKDLESSPWKSEIAGITPGQVVSCTVRRVTEFGTYFEIKSGIEGLVRGSEMSWTKRIKHPNEVFTEGQEIDLKVISLSDEKKVVYLSLKRLTESPWQDISEKYPAQTKLNGTIKYILPAGLVITVNDEIDGFMPRSKMRFLPKGLNNPGDVVEIMIDSIDVEKESLIIVPAFQEKPKFNPKEKPQRSDQRQPRYKEHESASSSSSSSNESASVTLQDLLSDAMKKNLLNN